MERWLTRLHDVQGERYVQQLRTVTITRQVFRWWWCRMKERESSRMRQVAQFGVSRHSVLVCRSVFSKWRALCQARVFARERDQAVLAQMLALWRRKALLKRHAAMIMARSSTAGNRAAFAAARRMLTLHVQ